MINSTISPIADNVEFAQITNGKIALIIELIGLLEKLYARKLSASVGLAEKILCDSLAFTNWNE